MEENMLHSKIKQTKSTCNYLQQQRNYHPNKGVSNKIPFLCIDQHFFYAEEEAEEVEDYKFDNLRARNAI
jgi:hypothetical protein